MNIGPAIIEWFTEKFFPWLANVLEEDDDAP